MPANPRLVRVSADRILGPPPARTARQQRIYDRIVTAAPGLLAEFGPTHLTMAILALALRITATTLRRHFVDIDDLLGTILLDHLAAIEAAVNASPNTEPNANYLRREAYRGASRGQSGLLTATHYLLVNFRHILPPDLLDRVEQQRHRIGQTLAGDRGPQILMLLDNAALQAAEVEAMLTLPHLAITLPKPRCPTVLALAGHNAAAPATHDVRNLTDGENPNPDVAHWQMPAPAPRATPPPAP